MRTFKQYQEDLFAMKPNVFIGNDKVSRNDHRIIPGMMIIKENFDIWDEFKKFIRTEMEKKGDELDDRN